MKPIVESNRNNNGEVSLKISGDFVVGQKAAGRMHAMDDLRAGVSVCRIRADELGDWDSTLVAWLVEVEKKCRQYKIRLDRKKLPDGLNRLVNLAFAVPERGGTAVRKRKLSYFEKQGDDALRRIAAVDKGVRFCFEAVGAVKRFVTGKANMRRVDFLNAIEEAGADALPIVALISFMVGLIVAFVGAVQLKMFGAQIYVASLVAIAMVRIMSAIMTGIIMAGRTGASYAATIGSMQVNEEVDALETMGIPPTDFLLLPRIMALTLMMPLLTVFSDLIGILGGAVVGIFMLDISPYEYYTMSLKALDFRHFAVGVTHGFVFGIIIAICGCYYGINSGRDADSVGKSTTKAVVSSIVWIVVATAVITLICQRLGI